MTKYKTKVPLDPNTGAPVYDDIVFKDIASWEVFGSWIVAVHSNKFDKKWLKKHPGVVHEEIEEEEE